MECFCYFLSIQSIKLNFTSKQQLNCCVRISKQKNSCRKEIIRFARGLFQFKFYNFVNFVIPNPSTYTVLPRYLLLQQFRLILELYFNLYLVFKITRLMKLFLVNGSRCLNSRMQFSNCFVNSMFFYVVRLWFN